MPGYAIAYLTDVDLNEEVGEYLRRIDDTLPGHGGRFVVHGSMPEVVEGALNGPVVLIEFPDVERARDWYFSPEYQAILPLRTRNSSAVAALLTGVPDGYRASSYLEQVDRAAG